MENFYALLEQMIEFAILFVIGIVGAKTNVLKKESLTDFSHFVTHLCMPFMIFSSTVNGATREQLAGVLPMMATFLVMFAVLYCMGRFCSGRLGIGTARRRHYTMMTVFGNCGFVGMPIMTALYPETGMLYIAAYLITDQIILWTLGVRLSYPEKPHDLSLSRNLRRILNPNLISILLADIVILTEIELPTVVNGTFSAAGSVTSVLAMIYIGALIAHTDFRKTPCGRDSLLMTASKLLVMPMAVFLILRLFMPLEMATALAVISGMPPMMSAPMLTDVNGGDRDYAAGMVLRVTILSLFTVPIVVYLMALIS